jgi:Ca-activated chloride channel family protein
MSDRWRESIDERRATRWPGVATLGLALVGCLAACNDSASRDAAVETSSSFPAAAGTVPGPVRETCSDNPYLAGCSGASPNASISGNSPASADQAAAPIDRSINDGDEFAAPGTNPFVMVDHDPLSTFAVDVDTASYDVFRRDVEDGILPDPASVRLEEYVNYFAYDYPVAEPDAELPFSISLAAAPSSLDAGLTLLRVGLQGKAPPAAEEKRPANLVFLVDTSGSMNESDRLPLAQQVLRQALDLLEPTDTVSIVSYAGDTSVRLAPTAVADRDRIVASISGLTSSGGTAGASGINLAYEQAQSAFIQAGINHVVLCTDGDFNVGISDTAALVSLIRDKRQTGITFTALGFGRGNLNDAMLEAISNAGNGFYGVISSESQAAEYVDERLLSTLSLIARDMKVQVEFNPELVAAYRLLGYENRAIADQDFRDDLVDAGEIGAGHRVTALYELVLGNGSVPSVQGAPDPTTGATYSGVREVASEDLVQVKIRYKHIDAGTTDAALELSESLAPSAVAEAIDGADLDLQWASAVAAFSEVLKRSPYGGSVDLDALGAIFEAQSARDDDRAEFYQLFLAARGML